MHKGSRDTVRQAARFRWKYANPTHSACSIRSRLINGVQKPKVRLQIVESNRHSLIWNATTLSCYSGVRVSTATSQLQGGDFFASTLVRCLAR